MSTATFIGIDLAWKSDRNPTGAAVLKGDRGGARLEVLATLYPEASVSEFVSTHATANAVVAIDAPLIIVNEIGQRPCETAVGKRYGSRDAACHTSNLRLYPNASSVALTRKLLAAGFVHADPLTAPTGRVIAEVYPHAAMVALWDLPKTIKYKRGSVAEKRAGLESLRRYLKRLGTSEPPLLHSGVLMDEMAVDLNNLSREALKNYEDRLDALFCGYLAFYFWYWGGESNEVFGDVLSGYILNPKLIVSDKAETMAGPANESSIQPISSSNVVMKSQPPAVAGESKVAPVTFSDIIAQAHALAHPITPSEDCRAGSVASVIISASGKTYSGVCVEFACGIGFCAEHSAIAEMLKSHESKISMVVAVDETGKVFPPCGRCREMMWQLDTANRDAVIILGTDTAKTLRELLPFR